MYCSCDTHVLAKWFTGLRGVIYRMGAMEGYTCTPMGCTVILRRPAWSPEDLCTHSLQQLCTCRMRAHARLAMRNLAHQLQGCCVGQEGVAQMIYHHKWFQANFWVRLWITHHWYLQKRGILVFCSVNQWHSLTPSIHSRQMKWMMILNWCG